MKKNKKNGKQSIQYFCKNCGVKINFHNALYRRALCVKCSRLGQKRPMQSENIKGVNNSNYKDGRTLKKHYCYRCNIEIQYATKFFGGGLCKRCSRIGKCNPNWKNGISKIPYSFDFTSQLKQQIRKRDNYVCQNCRFTQQKHLDKFNISLSIHHIDYCKKNSNDNNLITLCIKCHTKSNYNRDYWYAYCSYLMENRNEC